MTEKRSHWAVSVLGLVLAVLALADPCYVKTPPASAGPAAADGGGSSGGGESGP